MIEVYRNKYISKRAFIKDRSKIGNFLLIGITQNYKIIFTEYINGQIIEQRGFDASWFNEKGAKVNSLEIIEFVGHECFNTFKNYLQKYEMYEFKGQIIEVSHVGILFKDSDVYETIYLDSSLGAIVKFTSEILEVEKISNATEFFFLNFFKIRDKLLNLLFNQYKYFKEEVLDWEIDEQEAVEYPDITKPEEVRKLIQYKSLCLYDQEVGLMIQIDGDCSWDPEHGFTFRINEKLEIEEVHL